MAREIQTVETITCDFCKQAVDTQKSLALIARDGLIIRFQSKYVGYNNATTLDFCSFRCMVSMVERDGKGGVDERTPKNVT